MDTTDLEGAIHTLQDEIADLRKLKSTFICRHCETAQVQILYLPCRHAVACEACADKDDDKCVHCQAVILGTVKIYFA